MSQEAEAYKKNGYVFLPKLLSNSAELHQLQKKVHTIIRLRAASAGVSIPSDINDRQNLDRLLVSLFKKDKRHVSFVYDVMRYTKELQSLLFSELVLSPIKKIFEHCDSVVANNLNLRIDMPGDDWTENLPWHQDWPYNNPLYIQHNSIASWVALFDVPKLIGPLRIKEGSHEVGEIQPLKVPLGGTKDREDVFLYKVPDEVAENPNFREIEVVCEPGDVILFDLTLIHRSGINKSEDLIRWSAQARYHNVNNKKFLPKYL